ncbi:MAG TPA: hypothetical protein VK420_02990, partial [Longimicrobium sp.]|nr:hypothetical protein [Longimicrobium sp.]
RGSDQFPGVDTVWTLSSDAGVTFEAVGGSVTGATATANAIVIVAPECVSGTASFTATPYTSGDPTRQAGPSAAHSVDIQTVLVPLSSGGISIDGRLEAGSAQVSGSVSSNANCAQRRGLSAVMELRDGAGAVIGSPQTVPLTGPQPAADWRFTLPPVGCAGGSFLVNGQLVDQGGPGPSAQWGPVVLPRQEAAISEVTVVQAPEASCGVDGVARATFEARADLGAGSCQDVTVTWEQLSGAPVAAAPARGSQVSLTAEGGFEALIAEPLRFRVTADAGGGNAASREISIPVSVGNLVVVRHRTDVPVASESGILGVEVALTNQSGCAVSGAEYREMLDGLRLVLGSARLDGVPVAVTVNGDVMTVPGVDLPPGATRVLTYSARPRLLGRAQPRGQAFLRELAISQPEQGLPPPGSPGCGCSGGGAGLSSAALLLAVGLLRRSARRRAGRPE